MKVYFESQVIREQVTNFWKLKRTIGAMSRGVLVLARTVKSKNNLSIIRKKNTTTFTKILEDTAYYTTKLSYGNLFKPYEKSCEEEVCEHLEHPTTQYQKGSLVQARKKDSLFNQSGFVVIDENYISSRWAGDSYTFICKYIKLLTEDKIENPNDYEQFVNENNEENKNNNNNETEEEDIFIN